MSAWVTRTVLTGSSIDANGTASHTCTFTAATAGNFLVAVVAGSMTFTTPSGWTLLVSAVNYSGLYVFTKTAASGESSFSTAHNGSDYAMKGVVYEFPAGTSSLGSNSAINQFESTTGPQVSSLTGTYSRFAARSWNKNTAAAASSCAWTLPAVEDYDVYIAQASTDGISLTIAYDDGATGSSFTPNSTFTNWNNGVGNGEGVSWALNIGSSAIPLNWVAGING